MICPPDLRGVLAVGLHCTDARTAPSTRTRHENRVQTPRERTQVLVRFSGDGPHCAPRHPGAHGTISQKKPRSPGKSSQGRASFLQVNTTTKYYLFCHISQIRATQNTQQPQINFEPHSKHVFMSILAAWSYARAEARPVPSGPGMSRLWKGDLLRFAFILLQSTLFRQHSC